MGISRAAVVAVGLLTVGCGGASSEVAVMDPEMARAEAQAFRTRHEEDYRREWVTIAGLHFLEPGAQTAGSDASNDIVLPASTPATLGSFVLDGQTVRFEPQAGAAVELRGVPVAAPIVLRDDGETETDELVMGDVRVVVHRSGERRSLRVWDPDGELARGFLGFTWFPIQADYRVTGRFIPDDESSDVRVVNTFGDLDTFRTEGVVEFALQDEVLRLRAFTTRPNRLYFVFKDASSGEETYGAARFLYADLRPDGTAVLDFNQAYNPPCAFNPYTTCPIPMPENRLPLKVLAGERAYPVHPVLPDP